MITALGPEPGGLATWIVRLPPGDMLPAPAHAGGARQCHTVTAGSLVVNGRQCDRNAVGWVGPEEGGFNLCAGEHRLEVVVCRFPREALCRAEEFGAPKRIRQAAPVPACKAAHRCPGPTATMHR